VRRILEHEQSLQLDGELTSICCRCADQFDAAMMIVASMYNAEPKTTDGIGRSYACEHG
jgi:hypothetical protein